VTLADKRISRRGFLRGGATITAGAFALPALNGLGIMAQHGRAYASDGRGGYGPLSPVADLRDGVERLALPAGFHYRSISVAGTPMTDGNLTPLAHDGMAVFNTNDGFRLIRNHEDRNAAQSPNKSVGGPKPTKYDQLGGGGTTTLVVNPFTRELERSWVSLNGTIVNCAGGRTPWRSWLTCEETIAGTADGWSKQHGYTFEVPVGADSTVSALPLKAMGRFSHEANATDPLSGIVYETEDAGLTSGFYRFMPNRRAKLSDGGVLQMLAIEGEDNYVTYSGQTVGERLAVTWVAIPEPDPAPDGGSVFEQGAALGGAAFARLEGIWFGDGAFYFNSTSGGDAKQGQVWEYRPMGKDKGTLTLIFESPSADVLNMPDNITFSPQGGLLLCEDGDDDQYLRGVTLDGKIFDFALNLTNDSEWAGATFAVADPAWNVGSLRDLGSRSDRTTLFVNRQGETSGPNPPEAGGEGMTFAIWGPWRDGAL
jgi:secreted PhoX family phosphatase